MKLRIPVLVGTTCVTLILASTTASAGRRDVGREVLGPDDGWAAAEGGTTGGAAADDEHVYVVDTWEEFRAALGGDDARGDTTPRIVYVKGTLQANVDPDIQTSCDAYAASVGFDFDDYLARGATWTVPEDELTDPADLAEVAGRQAAASAQAGQMQQFVGSNVTIVGLGGNAHIIGANLAIRDSDNVIVRNLRLSDAWDCFPEWDPTDGELGTWNSAYDNVSVRTSTHVWIDHNTFDDGEHPPATYPVLLGMPFAAHDGLVDVTHGSNFVTISYNQLLSHDKTMLIGSSDSGATARGDFGKLKVTVHHNLFNDLGQRVPRVRFGQVHVYNNLYVVPDAAGFQYAFGVGRTAVDVDLDGDLDEAPAGTYAEDNFFALSRDVSPADLITDFSGPAIHIEDSLVNGLSRNHEVDILAAYNATAQRPLSGDVGWEPVFTGTVHPAAAVPVIVGLRAGAGRL